MGQELQIVEGNQQRDFGDIASRDKISPQLLCLDVPAYEIRNTLWLCQK